MTNPAFIVRQGAEFLRRDALRYLPGGPDERFRYAVAASWVQCADDMELRGARVVPFVGQTHVDPDANMIVDGAGFGNTLWLMIFYAADAYVKDNDGQ
jgi:hypothetical protein